MFLAFFLASFFGCFRSMPAKTAGKMYILPSVSLWSILYTILLSVISYTPETNVVYVSVVIVR